MWQHRMKFHINVYSENYFKPTTLKFKILIRKISVISFHKSFVYVGTFSNSISSLSLEIGIYCHFIVIIVLKIL